MHVIAAALDSQLSDLLASAGPFLFYLAVWGLVFVGTGLLVGVFIPFITGDSLLFASGLIAATTTNINPVILAIGVGIAAFLGDQVGFVLGRHFGRPYLDRRTSPRLRLAVTKTESFYEKYGWWAVVVARFMPWARSLIPVIAGIGRMNYYRFLSANLVGSVVWGTGMTFVGYFAAQVPAVKNVAYVIGFGFITASVIFGARTWLADRRERSLNAGPDAERSEGAQS